VSLALPPRCGARFRVERVLAAGAFGAVAEATQIELKRTVALKLLHGNKLADEGAVKRFLDEAKITASLSHPSIVRVLDHDVEDGIPWIAYELLPGGNLHDLSAKGPVAWTEACRIIAQVVDALDHAHARGILHRDIKPRNVMDAGGGSWKVADFGLAHWDARATVLTNTGAVIGTPHYMAPEMARGEPASVRSDLYALGVMFHELLAGEPPFAGDNVLAVLRAHCQTPPPHIRDRVPAVPEALDALIFRMLDKDPALRPASATEARAALDAVRAADPSASVAAPPPSAPPRKTGRPRSLSSAATSTPSSPSSPSASFYTPWRIFPLAAGLLTGALLLALANRPSPTPAPSPSPSVASRERLARAIAEVDDGLRGREFHVILHDAMKDASFVGMLPAEAQKAMERTRPFHDHHRELLSRCESEMPAALAAAASGQAEDLVLAALLSGNRVLAYLQVDRSATLLRELEVQKAKAGGTFLGEIYYGLPALVLVEEHVDLAARALGAALAAGERAPKDTVQVMRDVFNIGVGFIHYRVHKMDRKESERRVVARIGAAEGFGEGPQRRLAELMWLMSSNGTSERARRMVPEATACVQELAKRTPHLAAAWLELIARYTKRVEKTKETVR
jgi:serine/threonine protein kinase